MIFFSNIIDTDVRDNAEEIAGKTIDVLIKVETGKELPAVIGIVIKHSRTKRHAFIPAGFIDSWGVYEIELNKKMNDAISLLPVGDDIISVRNVILDKQIVDLSGMRVVRVNDLEFGKVQQAMCLIAIDISTRGIFRRLGLRGNFISKLFKPNYLEWKNVRLMDNKLHLSMGAKELVALHPADIANIVEKMNIQQGSILLQSLDPVVAARVIEEIQPDIKKILIKSLGTERTASLMSKMSINELVDLIQLLPSQESRELISKLPLDSKTQKVRKILEYNEDTAGGLMTTEYVSAHPETTVGQVIEEIKRISHLHHSIQYIYITNAEGKLLGVVSLRNLIIAEKEKTMKDIMRKPNRRLPMISVNQSLSNIALFMTKYDLLSVAVLDKEKRLLGVVTVDDVMRQLVPNA